MKRLHIHLAVEELPKSIQFYSALFASQPTVQKPDYAKWYLDDPKINFAISVNSTKTGLDHLGIQVDSEQELAMLSDAMTEAEYALSEQHGASCCYANSDKHWTLDPQGVAWETFVTYEQSEGGCAGGVEINNDSISCCVPTTLGVDAAANDGQCCVPVEGSGCCA